MRVSLFAFLCIILHVTFCCSALGQSLTKKEYIKVWFNIPLEPDKPFIDLIQKAASIIDNARASVDVCIYDIEHPEIAYALIRAKQRGVRIRLITDNQNRTDGKELDDTMWKRLREAGIISFDDDGDIYELDGSISDNDLVNAGADMHHKFIIIDALTPQTDDDKLLTGSTNFTYTGNFNSNVLILIQDDELPLYYTQEFEQMWGGSGDRPNLSKARFHKDKQPLKGKNRFMVAETQVEVYFSPIDRKKTKPRVSERIQALIRTETQSDISFTAFSITPTFPIAKAIWEVTENPGIQLRGAIDAGFYSRYRNQGAIWASPEAISNNRRVYAAKEVRKLHHKTIVIDAHHSDPSDVGVVLTGSYNFSNNADMNNDENLLVIFSDSLTQVFDRNMTAIFDRAEGQQEVPVPRISFDTLYSVYSVSDANGLEIELVPGFGYPIRLLGIRAPWSYRGPDSTTFYAQEGKSEIKKWLKGAQVRICGTRSGNPPKVYDGRYWAYIEAIPSQGTSFCLNSRILQNGLGEFSNKYFQHPDSVRNYERYSEDAKQKGKGMWRNPDLVWRVIPSPRAKPTLSVLEPININTADEIELRQLPGIGPNKASAIVSFRDEQGFFESIDEIVQVKGIGPKTLQKLRPYITTVPNIEMREE